MTKYEIQKALATAEQNGWALKQVYSMKKGYKLLVGYGAIKGQDRVSATSKQGLVEAIRQFNLNKILNASGSK